MHTSLKLAVLSRGLLKESSDVLAAAVERMAVKVKGESAMTRLQASWWSLRVTSSSPKQYAPLCDVLADRSYDNTQY